MARNHPTTRAELQPLLEAQGIRLRKEWGQNLLIDRNMLAAIGRDSGVSAGDVVIEIGVGAGSLTAELVERARLVLGVEIDRGMAELTRSLLADAAHLVVMRADVMGRHNQLNPTVVAAARAGMAACGLGDSGNPDTALRDGDDMPVLFPVLPPTEELGELRVVANLPYSISSPVLLALLESGLPIASMTLMLQLEVGRKLCAATGSDDWGLLSLLAQELARCELIRRVPAACFWPRPKVDSAIVRVLPHRSPDIAAYQRLRAVAHGLFQQRRKRILNGAKLGLSMEPDAAKAWLAAAGVDESAHAEALAPADLRRLAEAWRGP